MVQIDQKQLKKSNFEFEELLSKQNKKIAILHNTLLEQQKVITLLLEYVANAESHFEILDSYQFFHIITDLEMSIKSKKRQAVTLSMPSVADVAFLQKENEARKNEILNNFVDDKRQNEIAKEIASRGESIYRDLSKQAADAQSAANSGMVIAREAEKQTGALKTAIDVFSKKINEDLSVVGNTAKDALKKAESANNDLAALDEVVEHNFQDLQDKSYMTSNDMQFCAEPPCSMPLITGVDISANVAFIATTV